MAQCEICGVEIPRGRRFKGEKYKSIPVCSEQCYCQLLENKKNAPRKEPYPGYNRLMSTIEKCWGEEINWMLTAKQIKSLIEQYDLTCDDIRAIIVYAVKYEGYIIVPEYGLGQIFPKYIEPFQRFREQLNKIKENAEQQKDDEDEIVYVKPHKQNRKIKLEEDW